VRAESSLHRRSHSDVSEQSRTLVPRLLDYEPLPLPTFIALFTTSLQSKPLLHLRQTRDVQIRHAHAYSRSPNPSRLCANKSKSFFFLLEIRNSLRKKGSDYLTTLGTPLLCVLCSYISHAFLESLLNKVQVPVVEDPMAPTCCELLYLLFDWL
jgi:hypothetical protein